MGMKVLDQNFSFNYGKGGYKTAPHLLAEKPFDRTAFGRKTHYKK